VPGSKRARSTLVARLAIVVATITLVTLALSDFFGHGGISTDVPRGTLSGALRQTRAWVYRTQRPVGGSV
jgi:hypothetical protein